MNQLIYNASLLIGTGALSVGAGMQWGVSVGVMVAGAAVLVCTAFSAMVAR
jgi:hypothetical protein